MDGGQGAAMRVPNTTHTEKPWRIHEIVRDFTLEDVWAFPGVAGSAEDFECILEQAATGDPAHSASLPTRFLWGLRDRLGRWFDLGGISEPAEGAGFTIPGTRETSLASRLPADLRGTADDIRFGHLPFVPLYRTADEFAAEMSNRTVHGVMHLAWADRGDGSFHQQMAVYVKPRGLFGRAYMAFIKPFRYLIVYPALERQFERTWNARRAAC
jgi:uncharacterized protein DUF2867